MNNHHACNKLFQTLHSDLSRYPKCNLRMRNLNALVLGILRQLHRVKMSSLQLKPFKSYHNLTKERPCGPLWGNVTWSTKPEVHNVSSCRHRRSEPRPRGTCTKKFAKIGPAILEICSRRHTHTGEFSVTVIALSTIRPWNLKLRCSG